MSNTRYLVTTEVKDAIFEYTKKNGIFYEEDSNWYTDSDGLQTVVYNKPNGSGDFDRVTESLNLICTHLWATDFSAQSTAEEYTPITEFDPETGAPIVTQKNLPAGWVKQKFETEYMIGKIHDPSARSWESGWAIHERNWKNQEIGFTSMKYYEEVQNGDDFEDVEIAGADLNQSYLDLNCTRTDVFWMPNMDYMVFGGEIRQRALPVDASQNLVDLYCWTIAPSMLPNIIFPGHEGPIHTYAEGGVNLAYVDPRKSDGLKSETGSMLYYQKLGGNALPAPGLGSNRFHFLFRHPAGFKHRIQSIFWIGRPPHV